MKDRAALTVNDLLNERVLGGEELHAVAMLDGEPVRFVVIAANPGEQGELVLELDRRSIRERRR